MNQQIHSIERLVSDYNKLSMDFIKCYHYISFLSSDVVDKSSGIILLSDGRPSLHHIVEQQLLKQRKFRQHHIDKPVVIISLINNYGYENDEFNDEPIISAKNVIALGQRIIIKSNSNKVFLCTQTECNGNHSKCIHVRTAYDYIKNHHPSINYIHPPAKRSLHSIFDSINNGADKIYYMEALNNNYKSMLKNKKIPADFLVCNSMLYII
jgi:hypothetical protein